MLCESRLVWRNKVNCRVAAREGGLGHSCSKCLVSFLSGNRIAVI